MPAFLLLLLAAMAASACGQGTPTAGSSQAGDCEAEASAALEGAYAGTTEDTRHLVSGEVEVCGYTVGLAELEDLRFYAEQEGVALVEVLDRYGWQDDFGRIAAELEDTYPDIYAGAAFDGDDSWVAFKGAAPAVASQVIGDFPIKIIENRSFSEEELNRALQETHAAIANRPGVSAGGSYDQVTGVITINVWTQDKELATVLREEEWVHDNPAITTRIVIHDDPVVLEPNDAVVPLMKAEGWREALGRPLSGTQPLFAVLEIAFDRETAQRAWVENTPDGLPQLTGVPEEPGIHGDLDQVNLETHAIVVWSSGQSGSCAGWLADVVVTDQGTVDIQTDDMGRWRGACNDDYNPYRMVLAVARDRLPEASELPTEDVSGAPRILVTTYPAER